MCRLLGYLGQPVLLDRLISQSDHSLVAQSYQPQEMTAGLLNADGFGVGWYDSARGTEPFSYRNTLPIWNDANLQSLSRYIRSNCVLANVRSASAGLATDLSNCQPFQYASMMGIHNGLIQDFRKTLYRPIRERLSDLAYQFIQGLTDSEHLFAMTIDELETSANLTEALHRTLKVLTELAEEQQVAFSANLILSDGYQLVASRYAQRTSTPTLYYLQNDSAVERSTFIASEPTFAGDWQALPERCLLTVDHDSKLDITPI
ncbi:MAG TPA: ergothioneine biosynthesis protein EgtC [Leptolyngbya sp.]|jgi:glutamine amidotransferase|nr:ergothioneine biosynthesis protein EgtC [Leptolyngbya sp.]